MVVERRLGGGGNDDGNSAENSDNTNNNSTENSTENSNNTNNNNTDNSNSNNNNNSTNNTNNTDNTNTNDDDDDDDNTDNTNTNNHTNTTTTKIFQFRRTSNVERRSEFGRHLPAEHNHGHAGERCAPTLMPGTDPAPQSRKPNTRWISRQQSSVRPASVSVFRLVLHDRHLVWG